jgi:hypothetical protein
LVAQLAALLSLDSRIASTGSWRNAYHMGNSFQQLLLAIVFNNGTWLWLALRSFSSMAPRIFTVRFMRYRR